MRVRITRVSRKPDYETIPSIRKTQKLHKRVRNCLVRYQIAGTSNPDAANPLAVTSTVAVVLFAVMLLVHPFVLLFDRYRRTAHHLIAKIWSSLTVFPFFKVDFEGLENLPPDNVPAVYV